MTFCSALITGASGFIGRRLVNELLERRIRVIALGRASSVLPSGVTPIRTDAFNGPALRAVLSGQKFDVLFHLAAYGVRPDDRDPDMMQAINVAATGAFVEAAAQAGARAVVYAGSCSEYEPGENQRAIDEDSPLTTVGTYGASKVAGGLWGRALAKERGVSFSWIRLFGIYGPGEAPHRLIPDIVGRLQKDEIVSLTPGLQVRDLMFIDDAVRGLVLAAEAALEGYVGPFNLCTGHHVAVGDVARMIARQMGKPEKLLGFAKRPYRLGEPMWMVGRPDRFRSVTGHLPEISLDVGIGRTIAAR